MTRTFLAVVFSLTCSVGALQAQESRDGLEEPIYRVGANRSEPQAPPHVLDPALDYARRGLSNIHTNITDYTATLVKRERLNGELSEQEFMFIKVRNRKVEGGRVVQPLSIYLKFIRPSAGAGREVIWVEGQNEGKLLGHEAPGLRNLITVKLDPTGYLAMMGNRYPISEAGIENLIVKLIEKGERDRQRGECDVQFYKGAKINDRTCTLLQVTHPHRRDYFDFHIAQIFIDDQLQVPVRYAAYSWPTPGGKPQLEEEYTYMNLKVNVGLTDRDFATDHPDYKFPY
ncbi:DUF1571 domain-containing protein [Lignipirellula cremea]|uniref:DUF1571 domain-containing protein n=1 Tax=Lignipirellula cremea TaxID=2528010 RepID=A0A518DTR8_9BACT|nr:DUF1571 domain-containing protein [Lignipirellula cremea]QDU95237.1 hypothetical protein Pla8534_30520 [Lignipirellula cremea]